MIEPKGPELLEVKKINEKLFDYYENLLVKVKNIENIEELKQLQHEVVKTLDIIELVEGVKIND